MTRILIGIFFTLICCAHGPESEYAASLNYKEAIETSDISTIYRLYNAGVPLPREIDSLSPIHFAANMNQLLAIQALAGCGVDLHANLAELQENARLGQLFERMHGTPLHTAAINAGPEVINALIELGIPVNCTTSEGKTPFYFACQNGNLAAAQSLLDQGADPHSTAQDDSSPTALHAAVNSGNPHMVSLVLRTNPDIEIMSFFNKTALSVAVSKGHQAIVRLLLENGAQTRYGLHEAAEAGNIEMMTLLLSHQATDINALDNNGYSALACACAKNQAVAATYLIDRHANVDAGEDKHTLPLTLAYRENNNALVAMLIQAGATIPSDYLEGNLACQAIKESSLPMVQRFSTHPQIATTYATLLHCAISHRKAEDRAEVCTLLLDAGISIHALDKDKNTPLHIAVKVGALDIMELLLQRNAMINRANKNGKTPLHLSFSCANEESRIAALNMLLTAGANPFAGMKNRNPVINHAIYDNEMLDAFLTYLKDHYHRKTIKALVNTPNMSGQTPLYRVFNISWLDTEKTITCMHHLLAAGADPFVGIELQKTFLSNAADKPEALYALLTYLSAHYPPERIQEFVNFGAGSESGTILHKLTGDFHRNDDKDLGNITALLEVGADQTLCDAEGYQPIYYAIKRGKKAKAQLLFKQCSDLTVIKKDMSHADTIGQQSVSSEYDSPTEISHGTILHQALSDYKALEGSLDYLKAHYSREYINTFLNAGAASKTGTLLHQIAQSTDNRHGGERQVAIFYLLGAGADQTLLDEKGRQPIFYAMKQDNFGVAQALLQGCKTSCSGH